MQRLHPDAPLPRYALDGDAGADLCTMVDLRLQPGERALVPTGLAIALPAGYAGFVQPRSGLAWRVGLGMVNAPGTIDSGYRGEINVIVVNHDRDNAVELRRGDRIAQLVIQRVEQARFEVVERLEDSVRGAAGHGSTGGAAASLTGSAGGDEGRGGGEDNKRRRSVMALRRKEKRTEQSKLDATPPWETRRPHENPQTTGPFDVADMPADGVERLDLGALRVPAESGLEIRVEVSEDGQVAGVNLLDPEGQMQLGVFAAPRKEGIWAEIRTEIKASISSQGGTVTEQDGEFGTELAGRLPVPGGLSPVRFLGVDGPRWFVRAMLAGAPAIEEEQARPFLDAFRGVVVVRGTDPLPVREPVPLQLPKEAAEQVAAASLAARASFDATADD